MHEPRHTRFRRRPSHSRGRFDMHRPERVLAALDIQADGHDRVGTSDRGGDRALFVDVGTDRCDAGLAIGRQRSTALGMARRDPNRKPGLPQPTDDAAPEKAGAAEHGGRLCGRPGRVHPLPVSVANARRGRPIRLRVRDPDN